MISIVMPVHDTPADILAEAINSILKQTWQEFELIIVDDGSENEQTISTIETFCKDSRIRCMPNAGAPGAGSSRNIGLATAMGEYLIFLDSDDIFDAKLLEKLHREAIQKDLDISVCTYMTVNDNGMTGKVNYWGRFEKERNSELRLLTMAIAPWCKLYRREYLQQIGAHFQNIPSCNDVAFFCYTVLCTEKIGIMYDEALIKYRIKSTFQISAHRKPVNVWKAVNYAKDLLIKQGAFSESKELVLDALLLASGVEELRNATNDASDKKFYILLKDYFGTKKSIFKNVKLNYLQECLKRYSVKTNWYDYKIQLEVNGDELLDKLHSYKGCIFVWGMGKRGIAFAEWIEDKNIEIAGICDKMNKSIGEKIHGIKIWHTEAILNRADLIIATNKIIFEQLKETTDLELVNLESFCPL